MRADVRDEFRVESDVGVVAFDGFFDLVDVDVRAWADSVAFVAAEEVQVLVAVAVDRALDRQSLCLAGASAVAAVHRALEVVVVNAAAFLCCEP
ncbi:hypothetical protein [Amycolatopsis saalfeldensis]|uniref:hypothetical protein n=1 Tax=Amycolatopsis saalfeldensis TaxID=394193 RepID=UPI001FEAF5FB|nr:hypothetical protein [Amycolatopsis saalfeldensis]